jgi:ATP-dependent DNA helicase RecQ
MDIESIANVRNIKPSTIIAHIEKLIEEGKTLNLENIRPLDEDRLATVLAIFRKLDTTSLSLVKGYLEEEYDEIYDYDEIRLARLFL